MLKGIVAMLAACAMLAGCMSTGLMTPLSPAQVNALRGACATMEQLYPNFVALRDAGALKASVVRQGEYAYAVTRPLCATPANATYADVVTAGLQAVLVAKILKENNRA